MIHYLSITGGRQTYMFLLLRKFKTVADVPVSHPFIERLIGSVRREYRDHILFWNAVDLEGKLSEFQNNYNHKRVHVSRDRDTPVEVAGGSKAQCAKIDDFK